jgi:two-component system phosphate regulon response regulator PhoB
MAKESVLIVEDEEDIQELLRYNLDKDGYRTEIAPTGEAALKSIRRHVPDVVLLDLMLPGIDGLEIAKILKADDQTRKIPLIMVTAKGEEADIVTGLELGADDYITKPFNHKVLIARLRAVLRRREQPAPDEQAPLQIHDLVIHPGRHEVIIADQPIDLTYTEFRVLHYLARRPGWVFTRSQIVRAVHGDDYPVTDRSVDVQIAGLRKKLGEGENYIETVRGIGYRFKE